MVFTLSPPIDYISLFRNNKKHKIKLHEKSTKMTQPIKLNSNTIANEILKNVHFTYRILQKSQRGNLQKL